MNGYFLWWRLAIGEGASRDVPPSPGVVEVLAAAYVAALQVWMVVARVGGTRILVF